MKKALRTLGLGTGYLFLLVAFAGTAHAGATVPEVDPGSLGTAMALVVGGYLVIVSRFRRK
jgi:hypothetical protein